MKEDRIVPKIQVVLAAFNGAKYLSSQIESILENLKEGEILIHDDGSEDGTIDIINDWARRDSRIRILDGPVQGGAAANFNYLLENTSAPYVFCADQDDIWKPDKIQLFIKTMEFYESVYGCDKPLLVHSDLILINAEGHTISNSMWKYQNLNPEWGNSFNLLLTQNVITGCAMLVNRALLDLALPIPRGVSMHDYWFGLVACSQGKIIWIDEATVLYRQHGSNVVGARKYNAALFLEKIRSSIRKNSLYYEVSLENKTAKIFYNEFPEIISSKEAIIFSELDNMNYLKRLITIIRREFFMNGYLRNLNWMLRPELLIKTVKRYNNCKKRSNL